MSEVKWIILRNSDEQAEWEGLSSEQRTAALDPANMTDANFKGRRFKVIVTNFNPNYEKLGTSEPTLGHVKDYTIGDVYYVVQMTIKVAHTLTLSEQGQHWGSLSDLVAYFTLHHPSPLSGPTNLIYMRDHLGVERSGWLTKALSPNPVTTTVSGNYAYYFVTVVFEERAAIA